MRSYGGRLGKILKLCTFVLLWVKLEKYCASSLIISTNLIPYWESLRWLDFPSKWHNMTSSPCCELKLMSMNDMKYFWITFKIFLDLKSYVGPVDAIETIFLKNWTIFLIKNVFLKLLFFVKTDFWELPIILSRCLVARCSADSKESLYRDNTPSETAGNSLVRETRTSLANSLWVNLFLIRLCGPLVAVLSRSLSPFPKNKKILQKN